MDLSFLSDEKLQALQKGDLSSFTDDELNLLKGGAPQPDFETTLSQQTTKVELPQRLQEMKAYLDSSDPTSKEYKKIADAFKTELEIHNKMNPTIKEATAKLLPSPALDDIITLKDTLSNNEKLLELKNSGFGGTGIDTGPFVGGTIPIPFSDNDPKIVPSVVSEFISKMMGQGENSSDRALLRQLEKQLFNPKKKEISGTAASDTERFTDLLPLIPNESENDQAFFKKGLQLQKATQQKLLDIVKTAGDAGYDVSGFSDLQRSSPEDALNSLVAKLSQNKEGSFAREMPDTVKSFLGSKLQSGGLSPDKQKRLEELRRKQAEGRLQ